MFQNKVKIAVMPMAGIGTRFFPISRLIPKEFLPVGFKPMIHYIVEEAILAGVEKIIFVVSPYKEKFFNYYLKSYFSEDKELLKSLEKEKKDKIIKTLQNIPKPKIEVVIQPKPLGTGDAILRAESKVKDEPFLVLFGDDISSYPKEGPMAVQLVKKYQEVKAPLLCLYKKPNKELYAYGVPKVVKCRGKKDLYKIVDIIEKPTEKPPSNFALVGKYILTPAVFNYLKKLRKKSKEIPLTDAFKLMIEDGRDIFGLAVKGKWIECGTKEKWLEAFKYKNLYAN